MNILLRIRNNAANIACAVYLLAFCGGFGPIVYLSRIQGSIDKGSREQLIYSILAIIYLVSLGLIPLILTMHYIISTEVEKCRASSGSNALLNNAA